MHQVLICILLFPSAVCFGNNKTFDDKSKVAGRTLAGWTADLNSPNEVIRLRAVKSLGPFKEKAIDALNQCLDDKSDAVQYWAADHLGKIGEKVSQSKLHKQITSRLRQLASDEKKAISLAAAFALCQIEGPKNHLPSIIKKLEHPVRGVACSAAEFLGKIGSDAKNALPALEKQFKNHKDYHVRGACQNAIRKIKGQPVM